MINDDTTLYIRVVRVTKVYLGPAADRFVSRQVQNHLHKEPEELSEADLIKLIDWVKIAISFITEDSTVVDQYIKQLRELTQEDRLSSVKHAR